MLNTYEKFDECQFTIPLVLKRGLIRYMTKPDLEIDDNLFQMIRLIADLKITANGWLRTVDMMVEKIMDYDHTKTMSKDEYIWFLKLVRFSFLMYKGR